MVENLWDKYVASSRELESRRAETLKTLDGFLKGLGYLKEVGAADKAIVQWVKVPPCQLPDSGT